MKVELLKPKYYVNYENESFILFHYYHRNDKNIVDFKDYKNGKKWERKIEFSNFGVMIRFESNPCVRSLK